MASKTAHKRLMKEYVAIQKTPPPFIIAKPSDKNILEWHYVITGPPETPYEGGQYHGKVVFPSEYPFKPPAIQMITPNGRFKTQTRLCLSMSDFHPETWNPSWSVASILTGLLSFMLEDAGTTGSINTTDGEKRILARQSQRWNKEFNPKFQEMFPDLYKEPLVKSTANDSKSNATLSISPSDTTVPPPGDSLKQTEKQQQNPIQNDVILSELNSFISSSSFKMLLGGIAVYFVYALISKTFNV